MNDSSDDDSSIFAEIRAACAAVAAAAEQVRITDELSAYARSFDLAALRAPSYDTVHHFTGPEEALLAYLLTLDAINFGSGYFPWLRKRPGMSGYFTVASRLKEWFERAGPPSAERLTDLDPQAVAEILGQDLEEPLRAELMGLFAQALNDLGRYLLERFGGSFTALVAAAGQRAARLVELLAEMPFYQDVAHYRGLRVPLYKRAQITASDLALAFAGRGPGRFVDLDDLTIFADNLVPHVLRVDGVLTLEAQLAEQIAAGRWLEPGSPAEVELRAVALHAVEQMVAVLRAEGVSVTARQFDVALWNRGQQPPYRAVPRHRTRTVFY